MRVCFDHEIFAMQRCGGISRVFYELARHLKSLGVEVKVLAGIHTNDYIQGFDDAVGWLYQRGRRGERFRSPVNEIVEYVMASVWRPHIVHRTYYLRTYWDRRFPTVITVQDMIYERWAGLDDPVSQAKLRSCQRADAIVVPSEATRRDLIDIYGIPSSKVRVIYYGTTVLPASGDLSPPIDEPYLLYVGMRGWYKNFDKLAQAFARSVRLHNTFRLLCFGGEPVSREEIDRLSQLGLQDRVRFVTGDDRALAAAYRQARLTVIPSCHEGFGLTVLEAMALGCPVACSNATSLPEVAGRAAQYFDPHSVESIQSTLEFLAFNDTKLRELASAGRLRSAQFTWQRCANDTLRLYQEITASNN